MSFSVFDYKKDLANLFVSPHIRARFLRIEPGEIHGMHSHDLGHEVFFILEGHLTFYIDGEEQTLGPGQLCVALSGSDSPSAQRRRRSRLYVSIRYATRSANSHGTRC